MRPDDRIRLQHMLDAAEQARVFIRDKRSTIDRLIINSPHEEPARYRRYDPAAKLC